MVITMDLKHVILRGKTYHFRMPVPQNCINKLGKKEIVQSLKTSDPLEANDAAKKLAAFWKEKFQSSIRPTSARSAKSVVVTPINDEDTFRKNLIEQMKTNLPEILHSEADEDLQHRLDFYEGCIVAVQSNDWVGRDLSEIGVQLPLKPSKSPGYDRTRKRILCEVLQLMCTAVAEELGITVERTGSPHKKAAQSLHSESEQLAEAQDRGIIAVTELMIAAKRVPEKTAIALRADVSILREWCGGKDDMSSYTKRDLVDFVQNALPYLPLNMKKNKNYTGKDIRESVALTKSDPKTYRPISQRTCENRQANLSTVFNYAKDHLGLIVINPVRDIEIPAVRVPADVQSLDVGGNLMSGREGTSPDDMFGLKDNPTHDFRCIRRIIAIAAPSLDPSLFS